MSRVVVVAMAISLSATLPSNNTFQPHPNHPSSHIFPKQSPPYNHNLSFSFLLRRPNPIKRTINFSSSQSSITVSAVSGSPGIASSEVSEDTTSLLDTVQVFDLNGNGVPISDLWKDRKAVVAFARHFGCVLCRKRADYLAAKKDIMDAAGVALVLIGPGSVDQAKAFSEQTKFKGDPSYSSYKALRFVSGVSTTFTPGVCRSEDYTGIHGRLPTGLGAVLRKGHQDKRRLGNKVESLLPVQGKVTSHTSTRTKKQGMIQILKKSCKHVAHEVSDEVCLQLSA
ncbi:unnamed protein product [Camellia sinensis]